MIHPITAAKSRFIVWWLIWLLTGLGQSLLIFFVSDLDLITSFVDGFASAIIYSILAAVIWFPIQQLNQHKNNSITLLSNHLVILIMTVMLWLLGVRLIASAITANRDAYKIFWDQSFYYRLAAGIFIYALISLSYYLMISVENINRKNIRQANLENMLRETELMMLRSQINPHFLFNSLNSISSLTITNPEKARAMIVKLSEFMRYALSRKDEQFVALGKELENLRLYLEIEKVRFGEKLVMEENTQESSLKIEIPNMILQPLFENAIKHGVYESLESVFIRLDTIDSDAGTIIRITNNFDPESIPAKGTGTGLQNVQRRLDIFYNGNSSLYTKKENNTFIAEIFVPKKK